MKVGLISDIHSNLHALEAVLEELDGCEEILCLGDVVGYGAYPNECVKMAKGVSKACVLGNHDAACVGLLSLGWFNPYAASAARWTMDRLDNGSLAYLRNIPRSTHSGIFFMTHGSPREPTTEYLREVSQARASFDLCDDRVILVGHTHVPLVFMERDDGPERIRPKDGEWISYRRRRVIYNPGGVGQPRDGDPRAAYAMIDTDEEKIGQFRVEYDVEAARDAIIDAGLPRMLGDRLTTGR